MTKLKNLVSRVLPVFGILLFVFILYRVGLSSIWENLKTINLFYFGISIAILVPLLFLKAYKWGRILQSFGFSYSLLESFKVLLISYYVGSITPARLGDFSRALYLKEHQIPLTKAFSSVLIDRIFDLGILILMAGASVFVFANVFSLAYSNLFLILLLALIFATGVLLILKKNLMRKLLRPFFYMAIPEKYQQKLINVFDDFYGSILSFSKSLPALFFLSGLTVLTWFVSFLSIYFVALSIGLNLNFFILVLILPFTTLVESLPISFSGIGTRDAVLIFMLSFLSIPASQAVSFSVLILVLNYVMNFFGAILWIKKPFKF
ncbi:MAG: lysylphosphatidylglycerol synthase transmembrane domain-containing protein [archaeon]